MRQQFLIAIIIIFLTVLLIGLNAASYTQKEELPDREITPNRSTYNYGATGTRAFYDLLAETGRRTWRWQESTAGLLSVNKNLPQTFVIIGPFQRKFEENETVQLLRWVSNGGKLVIIDREPPEELLTTTANWNLSVKLSEKQPTLQTDPTDQKQMTGKIKAAKPVQPTVLTGKVNAVQPSQFASSIKFERFSDQGEPTKDQTVSVSSPEPTEERNAPAANTEKNDNKKENSVMSAPVALVANDQENLLVEMPFGSGEIIFLSDPYIVSNGGINLVDNLQIAVNIAAARDGIIAFDEYHHGYGSSNNPLFAYFEGTPLAAMFLQLAGLIGLFLFTKSRRFARSLPENEPNRLSKLEYVAAMAELQQRSKAFDLAIENIYTDFRRRTAKLVGVDNFTASRQDLTELIAERGGLNVSEVENLMFKCEDIIRGEPTNKREVMQITNKLREIEIKLGLQRRNRAR